MEHSSSIGALDGVVVLDLSRILAGPTATQLFGDLGATVIKIENPKTGGDDTRAWGPPYADCKSGDSDLSAYFMSANRNKYSVAADLSTREGQQLVQEIASHADIVVQNYKPGGLAKYGLDYDSLAALNPRLVYCSISGFGQNGPNRHRPGYDLMAQGYGGIMSLTGEPDGPPMKVAVGVADVVCGMYAAVGTLAALRHAEATGQGQHIDIGLVDSQMAWLINEGTNFLTSGEVPKRRGNAHPNIVPYEVFACADGYIILAVGNDGQFRSFCTAVGHAEWADDIRFVTNQDRIAHREALVCLISDVLAQRTSADILEILESAGVPSGPIHRIDEALRGDQAQAREMVVKIENPETKKGFVELLGNPLKLSKTPIRYQRPPPKFGQDTGALQEILAQVSKKQ